ncbi:ribosomal protein S5 domain 2-type protein [Mycena floridula]|nr:ribosomal protein S5 domain 2-type protein [Mycena floridula]
MLLSNVARPVRVGSWLSPRTWTRPLYSAERRSSSSATTWTRPIYASERVKDRGNAFCAHASSVIDADEFPVFLSHLKSSAELKRATHCMYAYRTALGSTGHNNGGESGAAEHLSRLLNITKCSDVALVVSRWYGGKLGSDRWKLISMVAKEALQRGGFLKPADKRDNISPINQSTKKKRRKK